MNHVTLDIYDYFPLISIKNIKKIQDYVDSKLFLMICVNDISDIVDIKSLQVKYNVMIFYKSGNPCRFIQSVSSNDENVHKILDFPDKGIIAYHLSPNRKIISKKEHENINQIDKHIICKSPTNVPYLLIEGVLNDELLNELIRFYNSHDKESHNTATKNRTHVHPNLELEKELDNKLSRSVFPEVKKIFYYDVKFRENYKICSYDAISSGRFHAHRDTQNPFQHRKYAMSLLLNDDYEGGEFELPEYNIKIKPQKNTAIIFPGICSHKVHTVTKGNRKAIITFFCDQVKGRENMYSVKSNFFEENDITYSDIYPV
jgi:hypothetical protein